jgi:hypothetical protein
MDDIETFRERFLLWFQSIMRAFGHQKISHATYPAMQDIVKQHLTPQQFSLFLPIIDLSRRLLGNDQ